MRRLASLVVLSTLLGLGAVVAAPAAAAGDSYYPLAMTGFSGIVVDQTHEHVFVTGPGAGGVLVRNLDGSAVTTITGEPEAGRMSLSPDGTTLYVVVTDAISAIDTTTLTETARWSTGAASCPTSVGAAPTKVWFRYDCVSPKVGLVDLAADPPAVVLDRAPFPPGNAIDLLPAHNGSLLLLGGLTLYAVEPANALTYVTTRAADPAPDQAVLVPGGAVLTMADHDTVRAYRTSDLEPLASFGTVSESATPVGLAAAANGVIVRTNRTTLSSDFSVEVFDPDDGSRLRTFGPSVRGPVAQTGVAVAPDASRLYVVSGLYDGYMWLRVTTDPAKQVSQLTSTENFSAKIDTTYQISGTLHAVHQQPAGTVLHVSRRYWYRGVAVVPDVDLPDVTTSATGGWSFSDSVAKRGQYTYFVSYAGDATHLGGGTSTQVRAIGLTPSLSISTAALNYGYGAHPVITAHLGPTSSSRVVQITKRYHGQDVSEQTNVKRASVDSSDNLTATTQVLARTVLRAYFAGDDVYEPRAVERTVTVGAKVTGTLSGYYATSGSYRVYRSSVKPALAVTVAPVKAGRCATYTAQRFSGSAWQTVAGPSCVTLSSTSTAKVLYGATRSIGAAYRIRASWPGDTMNSATAGSWLYFMFTT